MTSVVRAGHLAPYFKSSSQVVSNGLKPLVAVPVTNEKLSVQPLPKTSTVQSLHGSLPIQGLKVKAGAQGKANILLAYGIIPFAQVIMMKNRIT